MGNLSKLMERYLKKNKLTNDLSVLNTDKFDERRFNKLLDSSERLQELADFDEPPMFKELISDIWAGFYKTAPELKEKKDVHKSIQHNYNFMDKVMNDAFYHKHHNNTKMDEMLSVFGTMEMGGKVIDWFQEELEKNEDLQEKMDDLKDMLQNMQNQSSNNADDQSNSNGQDDDNENEAGNEADNGEEQGTDVDGNNAGDDADKSDPIQKAFADFSQALSDAMDDNSEELQGQMEEAMENAKELNDNLNDMFGGHSKGGNNELLRIPLEQRLELAELLKNNRKMKEIADWAGRFKRIARKKRKSKSELGMKRKGVVTGNDLSRILARERIQYRENKEDFIDRFEKRKLNQFGRKGKTALGRGSIIFILDQSGSMEGLDEQSKGFALGLISIAKKQKRNFAYIPFSSYLGRVREFPEGSIQPQEMIDIATEFIGQGTNFLYPLERAVEIIKKDKFNDADVVFVTDGESSINHKFVKEFNANKEKYQFSVVSLVIGRRGSVKDVESFSDRVIHIKSFNEDGAFEAFEI